LLFLASWNQPVKCIEGNETNHAQGVYQFPASNIQVGCDLTWFTNTPGDDVTVQVNALAAPIGGIPGL
jgi:hypothetical protein